MQFQSYLAQNSMGQPQRRRMYSLMDRHNLKSKVDIGWVESLQSQQLTKSKVLENRKHNGVDQVVQKYNKYVDKTLQDLYKEKYASISYSETPSPKLEQKSNNYEREPQHIQMQYRNSQQLPRNSNRNLDRSLNEEIQHFNEKNELRRSETHSNQNENSRARMQRDEQERRNSYDQIRYEQKFSLSPQQLKQMLLRSALDKPDVYSSINSNGNLIFRNFKPDNLQTYLRINQKRTHR